jgi:transcription antitermination factor NusG
MNTITPWFAIQTEPKSEKKVKTLLTQRGYACLAPTYRQKRRWSDRTVTVEKPLFPMYVFCQFTSTVIGKAVSTPGVSRIVGFGGRHAEISLGEIEALQLLDKSELLREPWTYIPDGTLVQVETGPLNGARGIICSDEYRRRLVISITLLQRSVAVQLGENTVISVIEKPKWEKGTFDEESRAALSLIKRAQ